MNIFKLAEKRRKNLLKIARSLKVSHELSNDVIDALEYNADTDSEIIEYFVTKS